MYEFYYCDHELKNSNQNALRCTAAVFALLFLALPVQARKSGTWADAQFDAAQRMQETLEGRPLETRTPHDYERVINAYRRVYMEAPTSVRADPSVVAAAQMSEEMGRRFSDPGILRSAIQQYEFLRREYPGSKFRFDALFRIGEIYKDDLHDKTKADATFEEFLHRYPRNQFADAARHALAEPAQSQASLKSKTPIKTASKDTNQSNPISNSDSEKDKDADNQDNASKQSDAATQVDETKPCRVLGIRHWSTPDYTRVAVDLEQGVKFESQRIDNPDRIFFDLLNTKLDPKLAKTFDVSDGLLKDVRMAQFKAGRTRVVLDLDELSEFNASLLANPPRLVIDIHNKNAPDQQTAKAPRKKQTATITETAEKEDLTNKTEPKTIADEEESPDLPTAAVQKPRHNTVAVKNGVKKTIVDADDEELASGNRAADTDDKDTIAKLDPPDIDSGKATPTNKISSQPATSDHAKSSTFKGKRKMPTAASDVREAQPTASGDRSLTRALGLKIGKIVIDPGHGGHDTGTIGPNGLEEKDLVLDVGRRLGKLLQTRMGAEVIYTRKDDTFIPLETRTAIANDEAADLFVSVHANSSHDPDARGVETYYLNFTSSPDALEVAARENAVSEKSIHELQDLVKKIALKEKIDESQEFAADVQSSLHSGLAAKNPGVRDRGVKKAPFIVLIGANMPSILAEISFVSNPGDERRLSTAEYRQKIAESLYRGIAKYVGGLSGVKVASKIDKDAGQ
jgi:N-acetylmuramoyl-L-alanine amidase